MTIVFKMLKVLVLDICLPDNVYRCDMEKLKADDVDDDDDNTLFLCQLRI